MIFFIVGPSGVGKTTVCNKLSRDFFHIVINLDNLAYVYHTANRKGETDLINLYNHLGADGFFEPAINFIRILSESTVSIPVIVDVGSTFIESESFFATISKGFQIFLSSDLDSAFARCVQRTPDVPLSYEVYSHFYNRYSKASNDFSIALKLDVVNDIELTASVINGWLMATYKAMSDA